MITSNNKNIETKDYVLGKFSKEEYDVLEDAYDDCYETVNDVFEEAATEAFYYGLFLGLQKSRVIKNE